MTRGTIATKLIAPACMGFAAAALLFVGACSHTKIATDTGAKPGAAADLKPVKPSPAHEHAAVHAGGAHAEPPIDRPNDDAKPAPIAMSPGGLLEPHAIDRIQDKLVAHGQLDKGHPAGELDEATREALRKFQGKSGLPATGIPDDETVTKLGLKPSDVFRSAAAGPDKHEGDGHKTN